MSLHKRGDGERTLALPARHRWHNLVYTSRVRVRFMTPEERAGAPVELTHPAILLREEGSLAGDLDRVRADLDLDGDRFRSGAGVVGGVAPLDSVASLIAAAQLDQEPQLDAEQEGQDELLDAVGL